VFIEEFFFSFFLLAYAAFLLILGSLILIDAFRRVMNKWLSKSSGAKDRRVVPVVSRPGMPEKEIG